MELTPDFMRAASRAYFAGVATTAILLALWLIAGMIVALRSHRAGRSRTRVSMILAVYALTGYAGYLAVLDPIALWFIGRVAIVEPFLLDPWWARNGVPAALTLIYLGSLDYAMRVRPSRGKKLSDVTLSP
ncbi:MAG TPA: hypothetical protein VHU41_16000 [Thermoanaerobaculia bacterium]|jgi:hypothetical protein|nr:hypothetical protein [Thermoanaerobaculia bacterium]